MFLFSFGETVLWLSLTWRLDIWISDHEVGLYSLINYHCIYLDDENINFIIKINLK